MVFFLGLNAVEGGFTAIVSTGDRAHLMLPADHPELPWTGILAVALVRSGYYYSTNQFITQRCLAAKNVWHGKMGVVLAAFLAIPMLLIVFLREMTGMLASYSIFNMSAVIFLPSLVLIALVSRFTAAPSRSEIESTLWIPVLLKLTEEERAMGNPWWKRVGFWFSIVVLCFSVIYAVFW